MHAFFTPRITLRPTKTVPRDPRWSCCLQCGTVCWVSWDFFDVRNSSSRICQGNKYPFIIKESSDLLPHSFLSVYRNFSLQFFQTCRECVFYYHYYFCSIFPLEVHTHTHILISCLVLRISDNFLLGGSACFEFPLPSRERSAPCTLWSQWPGPQCSHPSQQDHPVSTAEPQDLCMTGGASPPQPWAAPATGWPRVGCAFPQHPSTSSRLCAAAPWSDIWKVDISNNRGGSMVSSTVHSVGWFHQGISKHSLKMTS